MPTVHLTLALLFSGSGLGLFLFLLLISEHITTIPDITKNVIAPIAISNPISEYTYEQIIYEKV